MNLKHFLPAIALAAAVPSAMAVPAYPWPIKVTQPDGSVIEVRNFGDEHFHYTTDAKGEFILERNDKGFFVKAERMGESLRAIDDHISLLRAEQNGIKRPAKRMLGRIDGEGRSLFPTKGHNDCLVVLLEYSDRPFTPKAGYDEVRDFYVDFFNKKNFSDYDLEYSVIDYFDEVSSGQYAPHYDISPVVTLPKDAQYYVGTETDDRYRNWDEALSYALDYLDDKIDFSKYDNDDDGAIDFIYFIYAGYSQADTSDPSCIWPHQGGLPSKTLDGKKTGPYACSNELRGGFDFHNKTLRPAGIGTFCHEFGHVLGIPDLYDPFYSNNAYVPGKWSVMCSGCYNVNGTVPAAYTGFERWMCRWLEYESLEDETHYELAPITDTPRVLRVNVLNRRGTPTNEYYLLENRYRQGLDVGLSADGLIIWYVNFSSDIWTQNSVNVNAAFPRCTVVAPSAIGSPASLNDSGWIEGAYWPVLRWDGSLKDYIAPGTDDELLARGMVDYEKYHPMITGIKYDKDSKMCSFDFNAMEQPTSVTNITQTARVKGQKQVYVEWEPVADATSYELTVTRTTASGTSTFVDNLDGTQVGNVTSRVISNLTTSQLNQTMTVKIRAFFNGVPSSKEEVAKFVPSELPEVDLTGVDTIQEDAIIAGSIGCVIAPEGAEVCNLAGVRTGKENLPAGVYVVRYGTRVQKVVVK